MAKRYFKYSVAPFSGKNYAKNEEQANEKDLQPCAICGKGIKGLTGKPEEWPHWGIVTGGGARWADSFEDGGPGNMGAFPVGSDCHKRFVVKE